MSFFLKIVSLWMCLITPLCNLFAKQETTAHTYRDNEPVVKEEQTVTPYTFGKFDILVSPSGDDNAPGTEAAPVRTLARAKALAAEKRQATAAPVTVWFKGGTYYFDEPVAFTAADAENVTYAAVPHETVVFDGSLALTGWQADSANGHACLSAPVPDGLDFNSVFKNNETVPQTRYPESGYFYVKNTDHTGGKYTAENTPWDGTFGDLEFTPDDNQTIRDFKNPTDVTVRILHYWVDDFSKLRGYNSPRNRMLVSDPFSMKVEETHKYYYENVYEAFDKPGEWYYDRAGGKLCYIPEAGETAENLNITIALTDRFIKMSGCEGITLEGITFRNTNSTFPELDVDNSLGVRHPQAEYDCGGAVEITKSRGIGIRYCKFQNIGIAAVKFNREVKDSFVTGCDFTDIGATGVYIHGWNTREEDKITENICVTDNIINGYGRYFYSAIGVLLTHARDCRIDHNEICNGYYSGVSCGWVWGYGYNVTNHNSISYNHIYNIGQGWLSDMGGIYTLGNQPGTVLQGNVIHNVAADPGEGGYGGWGIYLDEGSADITVTENLVYDCGSEGFHQHYGEDNLIKNNIFALSDEGQMISSFSWAERQSGFADKENHKEFTLESNIFLADNTPLYTQVSNHTYSDKNNLCWDLTNGENGYSVWNRLDDNITARLYPKGMAQMGLYNGTVFADPGFRNPKAFDFTLPADSAVLEGIGFHAWNYNEAGTVTARES